VVVATDPFERLDGVGWCAAVPHNGFANRAAAGQDLYNDNPLGLATPVGDVEIETTPEHRNLVAGDPRCATWQRSYDDPGVVALRQRLRERKHDPVGGVTMRDLPVPCIHINFPLVDLTAENGPIRQIPGRRQVRAMPNVEYFAPWFRSTALSRAMSRATWRTLSPHAQRICRFVVADEGEAVIGEGFHHPRSAAREAFRAAQLAALGEPAAAEYLRRSS
jgi:hypothetical protein